MEGQLGKDRANTLACMELKIFWRLVVYDGSSGEELGFMWLESPFSLSLRWKLDKRLARGDGRLSLNDVRGDCILCRIMARQRLKFRFKKYRVLKVFLTFSF